jgi:hypothetical protein
MNPNAISPFSIKYALYGLNISAPITLDGAKNRITVKTMIFFILTIFIKNIKEDRLLVPIKFFRYFLIHIIIGLIKDNRNKFLTHKEFL